MIERGKADKWAARNARLAAALRENLKRRKAQARSRNADRAGGSRSARDDTPDGAPVPDFRRNPGSNSAEE